VGIDMQYMRNYFPYYENWVAQERYIEGRGIRMFSCWNGVAILTAKPFYQRKVQFRYSYKFRQSECMLLIADFRVDNAQINIINPNVKFAYDYYYYYMNKFIYPYSKNVFTYFYYYFQNIFLRNDWSLANMKTYVRLEGEFLKFFNIFLMKDDVFYPG
jgi:hypothetical protein